MTIETGLKMGAIAVGCAVISIVFCMVLNGVAGAYGRWFKNPYVRVVEMCIRDSKQLFSKNTGLCETER